MRRPFGQDGYLIPLAVMMIILFGLMGTALVHMFISGTSSANHMQAANKAFFAAQSGLEEGQLLLRQTVLGNRQSCVGLSATNTFNQASYQLTAATDTAHLINPKLAVTKLANATIGGSIQVSNSRALAPSGRVLIDKEAFDYQTNDTSNNQLLRVQRAVDSTTAVSHAVGSIVSQYQCTLDSQGQSPASPSSGERTLQQDAQMTSLWVVGDDAKFIQWNAVGSENTWSNNTHTGSNPEDLLAVDMLNYHDGWAVGRNYNSEFTIARWINNAWVDANMTVLNDQDLRSVSAVSNREAWAVGNRYSSNNTFTLLRWLGGANNNWCKVQTYNSCGNKRITASYSNSYKHLYAVKVVDTTGNGYGNWGVAVGGRDGSSNGGSNRGATLFYNGSTWAKVNLPGSNIGRLYGLDIISRGLNSPINVFMVGRSSLNSTQGKIVTWSSSSGFSVLTTSRRIYAVSMIDTDGNGIADYGWAVGDNGVAYVYNGSSWASFSNIGTKDLNAVVVLSNKDAWAVGDDGVRYHWDGVSWTSMTSNVSTTRDLTAIAAVAARTQPQSAWREIVN